MLNIQIAVLTSSFQRRAMRPREERRAWRKCDSRRNHESPLEAHEARQGRGAWATRCAAGNRSERRRAEEDTTTHLLPVELNSKAPEITLTSEARRRALLAETLASVSSYSASKRGASSRKCHRAVVRRSRNWETRGLNTSPALIRTILLTSNTAPLHRIACRCARKGPSQCRGSLYELLKRN